MKSSTAKTVDDYIAKLSGEHKTAIVALRDTINDNLPSGYEEGMLWNMPSWYIPLARYPNTYNKQPLGIASLAVQKKHMAIYLMTVYGDPAIEKWFRASFKAAGKKLDMGKSCVRFTTLDAIPLDVIGETIARVSVEDYIKHYEAVKGVAKVTTRETKRKKVMKVTATVTKKGKTTKVSVKAKQKRGGPVKVKVKAKRVRRR